MSDGEGGGGGRLTLSYARVSYAVGGVSWSSGHVGGGSGGLPVEQSVVSLAHVSIDHAVQSVSLDEGSRQYASVSITDSAISDSAAGVQVAAAAVVVTGNSIARTGDVTALSVNTRRPGLP